ncbi:MAG: PDZ domain-containing protein [Alphaproteobacteria bacterium]|nr:PDZ domain-containing protein [Alphaproteobacteria bacterium]
MAQGERLPTVAQDPGEAPGLTNARGALVIEVFKGSQADRVGVRSGDSIAAVDGQPVGGAEDLWDTVELVKGGEVVVLTVVRSTRSMPIGARIDAAKRGEAGPTSIIPSVSPFASAARRAGPAGPTSIIPISPLASAARRAGPAGPTNIIPSISPVASAAPADVSAGPTRIAPSLSPVAGAALRDRPAGDGVMIESVEQGGPAWRDGLRQDDVITSVNRSPVRNVAALETVLLSGENTVVFQVRRGANEIVVVLHR